MSLLDDPLRFDADAPEPGAQPAKVTLVGAGPGDPELLTLKAARALQSCSLLMYDHLVGREVLDFVPRGAHRIYVGKQAGHHTLSQAGIVELMVRLARSGRPVLRLKGGDPYVFGRGGEEAQALAANGIPFEVIPGISAAQGAAAAAGMPLTHRDHAGTLIFVTGHRCAQGEAQALEPDWPMLARPGQTVVFYMGVAALPSICEQLMRHGLDPQTPAAVVERATLPAQRTIAGTVRTLPALAAAHAVKAPALIMVGGVVSLREQIGAAAQGAAADLPIA